MNKFNPFFSKVKKKTLISILLFSLLVRLMYFSFHHPLWWDAHIYIGMAKYMFSGGNIGIWESFRPLLHPIILGFFWILKLNIIIIGKLLDLIFSLLSVYFTYLIGKKIFNEKTGLIAAAIFSLTPLFLMLTGMILTEPLAILLSLLGVYLFLDRDKKMKIFLAGLLIALSFMSKFPQGIIFAALSLVIILDQKTFWIKIKQLLLFGLGFSIPVLAFLIFNYFTYGDFLQPFTAGAWIVTTSTWVYGQGKLFYFFNFFLRNWIYLFFFASLYYYFKEKEWKNPNKNILFFTFLLFFFYFSLVVPRKEVRYLVTALPFIALIISQTILMIYNKLKSSPQPLIRPTAFIIICVLTTVIFIPTSLSFEVVPTFDQEIKDVIEEYNIEGIILTSDPSLVSSLNHEIVILSAGMDYGPIIYQNVKQDYEMIFINDCDFICSPQDQVCFSERQKFLELIEEENIEIFKETATIKKKECNYTLYLKPEVLEKNEN
jgi:4-amino-4-deoxy-L-arabinose transferase-like glycosyltransferase